jgi:16S rRNA (uracil1498-N3)-methyltransferase
MHARFYAPDLAAAPSRAGAAPGPEPGDAAPRAIPVRLPPEEAGHLLRVLRLGAGAHVQVFDGRGHEYLARVESTARQQVLVTPLEPVSPAAEPSVPLTLAQALLKGDRMDGVVRDAAMLGVVAVRPIVSGRTEVPAAHRRRPGRAGRWERVAIASVKQCGRAVVPEVSAPVALDEYLAAEAAVCRIVLVEPRASLVLPQAFETRGHGPKPPSAALLIGPEGGWADGELRAAVEHGFRPLTLGPRTLRADAMPVAAISVLQFLWGDL